MGRGERADVPLPAASEVEDVWVVVSVGAGKSAAIRRASQAAQVEVIGVALGAQPSPLFHGDRVRIGGTVVVFGDEAHAGATRQMAAIAEEPAARPPSGPRARLNGRVVSLVDGREYTARADGLTIGREPGCDIVLTAGEVSRRHARIELRADGYVIVDMSTNGVLVNGLRVDRIQALSRGDTIRIGSEELRFHADLEEAIAAAPTPVILEPPPIDSSASRRDDTGILVPAAAAPRPRLVAVPAPDPAPPQTVRAEVPWVLLTAVAVLGAAVLYLFLRAA